MILREFHEQKIIFGRPGSLLGEIATLTLDRYLDIKEEGFQPLGQINHPIIQKMQRAFPSMKITAGDFRVENGLQQTVGSEKVYLIEDQRYAIEFSLDEIMMYVKSFRSKRIDGSAGFFLRRFVKTIFDNTALDKIVGRALTDERYRKDCRLDEKYKHDPTRSKLKHFYLKIGAVESPELGEDFVTFLRPASLICREYQ
jgi:hypothetical protein